MIFIVSVPYWEWDEFGKDCVKKQQYLRSKLGLNDIPIISVLDLEWIEVGKVRAKKQQCLRSSAHICSNRTLISKCKTKRLIS